MRNEFKKSVFPRFSLRCYLDKAAAIDTRALGVMRIGFALILILDLITRAKALGAHYTDAGILPRAEILKEIAKHTHPPFLPPHFWGGSEAFQGLLFLLAGLFAFMLLIGYRSKLATIMSWFLLISLQARNPFLLQGGDDLLRVCLFWAIFLPWGARFSIDSVLKSDRFIAPPSYSNLATLAFLLQNAFVYFFAAKLKTGADWQTEGSALFYALSIDQFATPAAEYLLQFPALLKYLTFTVLYLEALGPLLLFSPVWLNALRTGITLMFICMQIGILITLKLGLFPFISIVALLGFFPAPFWDRLTPHGKKDASEGFTIFYDADCSFCKRSVSRIKHLFSLQTIKICPNTADQIIQKTMKEKNSWIVVDPKGNKFYRFDAFLELMSLSFFYRFLTPFFRLSPVRLAGDKLYGYVASHRLLFSKKIKWPFTFDPHYQSTPPFLVIIITILIMYTLSWNMLNIPGAQYTFPKNIENIGFITGLRQEWRMFAPRPYHYGGWYIVKDQKNRDLLKGGLPVNWDKPDNVAGTFASQRWRKFYFNLNKQKYKNLRPLYAQHLCRQWNTQKNLKYADLAESISIIFMREETKIHEKSGPAEKEILLDWSCLENL